MKKLSKKEEGAKDRAIRSYLQRPKEEKFTFYESLLSDVRHERIRDFIVSESKGDVAEPSLVIHVPSGMWHSSMMSYEYTLQMLRIHPEDDDKVMAICFGAKVDADGNVSQGI